MPNTTQEKECDNKFVSITEAARINKVTRQAIYVAIKLNKLKAKKESTRWEIHLDDLEEYRKNKYSRNKSTYAGELLFDNDKGFHSVRQVADLLEVDPQKIYYETRIGRLESHRKGSAWVIHINDVNEFREKHFKTRKHKRQAS